MNIMKLTLTIVLMLAWLLANGQTQDDDQESRMESILASPPTATRGGVASVSRPQPLAESDDTVNQLVSATTTDGLVLSILIDGTHIELLSAYPARVPIHLASSERNDQGDLVRAVAMAGGQQISTTVVPDLVINSLEGEGLVRVERREISLVLQADVPLDSVEISAPATDANAVIDVRQAYARWCEADPRGPWCPRQQ